MTLFAHITNGTVTGVIVAEQWFIDLQDDYYIKSEDENGITKNISAGIGYIYDDVNDVFITPQPYPSWSLDDNYEWKAPITKPDDNYIWNEDSQSWEQLDTSPI